MIPPCRISFAILIASSTIISVTPAPAPLALPNPYAPPLDISLTSTPPETPACTGDPAGVYNSTCWKTLDLSNWLRKWEERTPACRADQKGTACCNPHGKAEPWSTCFLRLALGDGDYEACTKISGSPCVNNGFQLADSIRDGPEAAQYRYVVRNIHNINNVFETWYTAVQYAIENADSWTVDIINFADPLRRTNVLANILLNVFTGLLMILTAGIAIEAFAAALVATAATTAVKATQQAASISTRNVVEATLIGLQTAPLAARAMWPTGTDDSRLVQLGNIESEVGNMRSKASATVSATLNVLMSDLPSFIGFAGTGSFSNQTTPSIDEISAELMIGFRMFILTSILKSNNWRGSWYQLPGPVENKMCDLTSASQETCFHCKMDCTTGICTGSGAHGGNSPDWSEWTSTASQRAWTLDQKKHHHEKTSSAMTHKIVTEGWAPLDAMFDGAYSCAVKAGSRQNDMSPIIMNPDGSFDLDCMSQLPISIGCDQPCPVHPTNGSCNFEIWDGC